MKSSELHRLIKKNGWKVLRQEGSHYIYQKGDQKISVPFHGTKEVATGLARKLIREMGLK